MLMKLTAVVNMNNLFFRLITELLAKFDYAAVNINIIYLFVRLFQSY